ncbi:aspartate--tRNA ligase, chloroplastic/mitochondrial [Senna tora]|uniref:Aspartate--tRNA ligase, chloroplastic/mitochondrial n=1 Tax=Senna tora TaxID=362788 RepID=A0A834W9D0_9FABA|nr:aspartate--tRNA ligase, chloroplastic/mitochondrial [Senna tora]
MIPHEDLRTDRQPKFTQLVMEMAFTPLEDMLALNEDLIRKALKSGAKGLPFLKVLDNGEVEGIVALVSSMDPTAKEKLLRHRSAGPGDLILFVVGHHASALELSISGANNFTNEGS